MIQSPYYLKLEPKYHVEGEPTKFDSPDDFLQQFPQCSLIKNSDGVYQVKGDIPESTIGYIKQEHLRLVRRTNGNAEYWVIYYLPYPIMS